MFSDQRLPLDIGLARNSGNDFSTLIVTPQASGISTITQARPTISGEVDRASDRFICMSLFSIEITSFHRVMRFRDRPDQCVTNRAK